MRFLDGARKSHGARIEERTTGIDNLLTNSVAVDGQQKPHHALHELFGKLADANAAFQAIEEDPSERGPESVPPAAGDRAIAGLRVLVGAAPAPTQQREAPAFGRFAVDRGEGPF